MMKTSHIFLFLLSTVILACSPATVQQTYESQEVTFTMLGPLFAGANSAQIVMTPSVADMLGEGRTIEDIQALHLSSATFTSADSIPFQYWEGIVLQLVSDKSPMVNAGVLNPVPQGESRITIKGSTEADLTEVVKDGTFYIVADINLEEDVMDDLEFTGTFTFDIAVKE